MNSFKFTENLHHHSHVGDLDMIVSLEVKSTIQLYILNKVLNAMSHKRERFISKGLLGFALSLSLCKHFYSSLCIDFSEVIRVDTIDLDWFRVR